jgi:hypothetical protein
MNAEHGEPRAERNDGVELWARRVGRMLGWVVAVLLVIYLLRTYAT